MVVIRLIGDEWKFGEKLAIAIPPSKAFNMCTTVLREKLQIPSFNGCALYFTEGKPPSYVRATVPVPMSSNPGKENMKDGVLLYVKVGCDATRQRLDAEFHAALQQWRRENNIASILSDGSDVFEFIDEYSSRLNPSAALDINDHEQEKRAIVEGEENRAFFVLTFEYREIQGLKDKESAAREELRDEWRREWFFVHRDLIALPRIRSALQQTVRNEEAQRQSVINDSDASIQALSIKERDEMRVIRDATAAASAAAAATAGERLQQPPQHDGGVSTVASLDPGLLQQLLAMRGTTSMSSGGGGELAHQVEHLSKEMRQEIADLRAMVSSLLHSHQNTENYLADAYHRVSTDLERRYLQNLQDTLKATECLSAKDVYLPLHQEEKQLQEKKQRLLRELLAEVTKDMESNHIAQQKAENQVVLEIVAAAAAYQSETSELVENKMRELELVNEALHLARNENHDLCQRVYLQDQIIGQQEAELKAAVHALDTYQEVTRYGDVVCMEMVVNESGVMRLYDEQRKHWRTLGLHQDVYDVCLRCIQKYSTIPEMICMQVLGYALGATVRRPDPLSPVERRAHDDQLVRTSPEALQFFVGCLEEVVHCCGGSAQRVSDELCFKFKIMSSSQRNRILQVLDDCHPHLSCVVDLILDIFEGREAELMVHLLNQTSSFDTQTTASFVECWDHTTQSSYYYHAGVDMTQWHAPRAALTSPSRERSSLLFV